MNMYLKNTPWNVDLMDASHCGIVFSANQIQAIMEVAQPSLLSQLFEAARRTRRLHFGDRVFLYGFLYFSTYCRNNCIFCQYRQSNSKLERYRKTTTEILNAARRMAASGVHLIDLTMGEDEYFYHSGKKGYSRLARIVEALKTETRLPIMISPGVLPDNVIKEIVHAGADWYACYQETHSPGLFAHLRAGQDYHKRMAAKLSAKKHGLFVEEGILTGVGEKAADIVRSLNAIRDLDADQARVMTLVPQHGTPMANVDATDDRLELIIIAIMRLMFPDLLIPASLDVRGLDGLKARLNAGANIVTSLIPPGDGLAGVAEGGLDIDEERRTTSSIGPILSECGLKPAGRQDYLEWMAHRRRRKDVYHMGDEKCALPL